jgi:hypothetical protein
MRIKCPKCGLAADVQEAGGGAFKLIARAPISSVCPIVQERMRPTGRTDDMDCPELALEAARARQEVQRRL